MSVTDENEVTVTLRLIFKPGTLDSVLAELLPIAHLTRGEKGNIEFNVYRARDETDQLFIFERWTDQSALERHWQEDYTKRVLALFDENLLRPLSQKEDVTYLRDLMDDPAPYHQMGQPRDGVGIG